MSNSQIALTDDMIRSDVNMGIQHNVKQASDGAQLLYEMVCKAHGKNIPIFPVRPQYLLTTDDTIEYIFEGKEKEQNQFRLCLTKALEIAGTRSKNNNDGSNSMRGLRVKLAYTFSEAGVMTLIFVSVLGLNERDVSEE